MARTNIIQEKSFDFAVKVVKAVRAFRKEEKEFEITGQLLRISTSIGVNIEEAIGGYSTQDFLFKLSISYREARESRYWLRIMRSSDMMSKSVLNEFLDDCEEVLRILGAITKTLKTRNS